MDTSALIAIQFAEPEAVEMKKILRSQAGAIVVGAPTLLEYYMVIGGRYGAAGRQEAHALVERLDLKVLSWTDEEVELAVDAFQRYGLRKHPARLNFGDCMAYAMAKSQEAPLLYKGDDFRLTDITPAL